MRLAVLLLAYGGPDSLDDIEPFLLDIRGGRETSRELIEEIRQRYRRIGGRSPLLEITRAQARALEERLDASPGDDEFRVHVGMRHWHPYIRQTVGEIAAEGCDRIIALCMAPHYSRMSIGAYFKKVREALDESRETARREIPVSWVESWGDHPLFLRAVAEKVEAGLAKFSAKGRAEVEIVFTAHSLPTRILGQGDPYDAQLQATASAVGKLLGGPRWRFCYQSAGAGGGSWLGPRIEDVVHELAAAGRRNILVAPLGFVCDHVEILFDLDIEAREIAEAGGARLERTESMNVTPVFIEALADLARRHAG